MKRSLMWNRGNGNTCGVTCLTALNYGRDGPSMEETRYISYLDKCQREGNKAWKAGYYGLTIISATWLPLYCSIHASDVYCNCTNNLSPTTYTGRIVDQLGNVRSFHRRAIRFNAFLRLLLAGVLLFQLFEYWGN